MPTNFHVGDHAPLLASQKENEWPREDHTNPFAQPERTGIARVHQQSQDQPGAKVEPSRRTTAPDRRAQATFFRRRRQPSMPSAASIRPGRPTPAIVGRHAHRHKVRRHVCYDFSFMGATNPKPIGCRATVVASIRSWRCRLSPGLSNLVRALATSEKSHRPLPADPQSSVAADCRVPLCTGVSRSSCR
jgi:hypothetical protein